MNSFKNTREKGLTFPLCFVCFALSCALCEKTPETINTLRDDERGRGRGLRRRRDAAKNNRVFFEEEERGGYFCFSFFLSFFSFLLRLKIDKI